jgi:hypothetical protein
LLDSCRFENFKTNHILNIQDNSSVQSVINIGFIIFVGASKAICSSIGCGCCQCCKLSLSHTPTRSQLSHHRWHVIASLLAMLVSNHKHETALTAYSSFQAKTADAIYNGLADF